MMAKGIQECRDNALEFLKRNNYDIGKTLSRGFISAALLLTHKCNLSCPYCYQADSFKSTDSVMTKETADKAIKFIYTNFGDIEITISLFGGEPFLNFEVIKYLVEKYPQIRFVATTNGKVISESSEIRNWIRNHTNLILSFSFNALKPIYNGSLLMMCEPIFDLLKLNHGEVHYVLDTPFDTNILKNIQFMLDCGIPQLRVNLPKEQDTLVKYKEEYTALSKQIADLVYKGNYVTKFGWDAAFRSNACRQNKGIDLLSTSSSYCGAGFNYIAIDDKGDIYPCDYFAEFPEFKIGDIENGFSSDRRVFKDVENWHNEIYGYCEDCPLGDIRLCPNPMCYAENYKVNKNILKPTKNACVLREIEYATYKYVSEIATETREKINEATITI